MNLFIYLCKSPCWHLCTQETSTELKLAFYELYSAVLLKFVKLFQFFLYRTFLTITTYESKRVLARIWSEFY